MSGLIALLDDVAAISKVAAASIDDVAGQAAKAGAKAAGAVIDDAAVTPKYVHGFDASRELPIVWKIAKGSLFNKIVILTPIALPPASYLVLKPPVAIPTAAIFSSPLLRRDTKPATMAVFLAEPEFGKNDLQAGAEAYSKQVVDGLEILKQNLGLSRMSGSGSAVFAQYPEVLRECSATHGELTEKILRSLATPNESWIARTCRSLEMHPMQHWVKD